MATTAGLGRIPHWSPPVPGRRRPARGGGGGAPAALRFQPCPTLTRPEAPPITRQPGPAAPVDLVRPGPPVRPVGPVRPAVQPQRRRRGGTRLTNRGRMLVFVLMAAVATVFLTVARDPGPPAAGIPVRHVVVQPGQTLWSIAQQVAPGADPRGTVGQLERLNGLAGPQVYPGEALRVPAR